ncbi:MAG: diaminopimelate epimerase [Elusimicrobia bacterium]|jgi:diaminopimelate epimerase|nr:diaminopimelate epimerase [Elusimicrobiota bacterium]
MKKLAFTKMEGTGNDFVLLDAVRHPVRVTAALARRLCDRRFGVGADQVLVLAPSREADFKMLIFNADGSQVEMCGNGIRCLARYAFERGHTRKRKLNVETLAGIRQTVLVRQNVRVDMGAPLLDAALIPTRAKGRVIDHPFSLVTVPARGTKKEKVSLEMTCVSMGNPHAVVFVEDVDGVPLAEWGAAMEQNPFFPRRTNVEFVQVTDPDNARVRVWERGSGATLACGTGACAVGVAGVLTGRFHRKVTLSLPGGPLTVEWNADNRVYLTGPATFVFDGMFEI